MKKRLMPVCFIMCLFLGINAFAEEQDRNKDEIKDLKERIEKLERQMEEKEVVDELGHKLHPVHSMHGLKLSGGMTMVGQGTNHLKGGPSRGAFTLSGDLNVESNIGDAGRAAAVFDIQMGAGLKNLPPLAASPNGNPTGPNNDVESPNSDTVRLTQVYYEHNVNKRLTLTMGKLDPTAYFDANAYANSEKAQFLANGFVNNPVIEFGGNADFYGPGLRATVKTSDSLDLTLGAFEGKGDFNDTFDNPFLMAEADIRVRPDGREGNYRVYLWNRSTRPGVMTASNPTDSNLVKTDNRGMGMSIDQALTGKAGVWLRFGVQRQKVAQFDKYFGGGINLTGLMADRKDDALGFGYGASFIGTSYEDYQKTASPGFKPGAEHYLELYYNIAVGRASFITGFHITPDVQLVINPGGDTNINNLLVYGIRLQAFF